MLIKISKFIFALSLLTILAACGGQSVNEFDGSNPDSSSGISGSPASEKPTTPLPKQDTAKQLYNLHCANCHGESGQGAGAGGELYQCDVCDNRDALFTRINTSMPIGNPESCDEDCGHRLTNLILSDFEDLEGMGEGSAPQDNDKAPTADISLSRNTSGTVPLRTEFNASHSSDDGQILSYHWDFGDNTTGSGITTQHIYRKAGDYIAKLTVTDNDGQQDQTSFVIKVFSEVIDQQPQARFSMDVDSGTAPLEVNFDASESTDDMGIVSYEWNFGDGSSSNGSGVSHTFSQVGEITISLTTTDTSGQTHTQTNIITVAAPNNNLPPRAEISTTDATTGEAPVSIQFSGIHSSDDKSIASYLWNFGDGNVASGRDASHTFTQIGRFTTVLTVVDSEGLSATDSIVITISSPPDNQAPIANASLSKTVGLAPLLIQFNAERSRDDNAITRYVWSFGNGETSNQQNPNYTFTSPGNYSGSLTVYDDEGLSHSVNFTIVVQSEAEAAETLYTSQCASCHGARGLGSGETIPSLTLSRPIDELSEAILTMPPNTGLNCGEFANCERIIAQYILDNFTRENAKPSADASNSRNLSGEAPLNVSFDARASSDDHKIQLYDWDFGDGSTGSGAITNHVYSDAGSYIATLTVIDEEGLRDTTNLSITVTTAPENKPPIANASASQPSSGVVPLNVRFDASLSGDDGSIVEYRWEFGDGSSGTGIETNHTYTTAGNYTARLFVRDAEGLESSTELRITVDEPDPGFVARSSCDTEINDFYEQEVDNVIHEVCSACHSTNEDAAANGTRLEFSGNLLSNRTQIEALANNESATYILTRPIGAVAHGGGKVLEQNSSQYGKLAEFVNRYTDDTYCEDDTEEPPRGNFYDGLIIGSNRHTLSKASSIMLGRRPSQQELNSVSNSAGLRATLRAMMDGKAFDEFIKTSANNQLHTRKFKARDLYGSIFYDNFNTPGRLDWPFAAFDDFDYRQRDHFNAQVIDEPLELIAYIAANDLDYRMVLLAPFTLVNKTLADGLGGNQTFDFLDPAALSLDPNNLRTSNAVYPQSDEDWVPVRYKLGMGTGYRIKCCDEGEILNPSLIRYPHTGVLTTQPWLLRWPNSETNGQRKRVNAMTKQFINFDFEDLANRPVDADIPLSTNPTLNNPNCTSCHKMLDAMAGGFQNWGTNGLWRTNSVYFNHSREYTRHDALPRSYKRQSPRCDISAAPGDSGYCDDDIWYRDRFIRGYIFEGDTDITPIPGDTPGFDNDDVDIHSLRWLTTQITSDGDRYARGTAKFWLEAIMGNDALKGPEAPPFVSERLRAFTAQQETINAVANVLQRDNGNGIYNLKDALVELFMSPWFRAVAIENTANASRSIELANLGSGMLLTPEQLTRKVIGITTPKYEFDRNTDEKFVTQDGIHWRSSGSNTDTLVEVFNTMYGGIDSDQILDRNREMTSAMANLSKRMAAEISCNIVRSEFHHLPKDHPYNRYRSRNDDTPRLKENRNLFKHIDVPTDNTGTSHTPDNAAGERAIKQTLAHLHHVFWNEHVVIDSPELLETYQLFVELWELEKDNEHPLICQDDNSFPVSDSNYIKRALKDILIYMMIDFAYLHE